MGSYRDMGLFAYLCNTFRNIGNSFQDSGSV